MELTLKEIVSAGNIVHELSQLKIKSQKILYWLAVTQRKLSPFLDHYEKFRNQKVIEFGKVSDDGKTFILPDPETRLKFNAALDEFLSGKETLDIHTIKFAVLTSDPTLDLTADSIADLGSLVEMGEMPE